MLGRLFSGLTRRRARAAGQSRDADAVERLLVAGVAQHKRDHLADAERSYLEVLTLDPDNADALNLLGAIAQARLDYDSALDYYRSALRLAPDMAIFQQHVGLALSDLGRLEDALEALRRAHELDPANERIGANLLFLMRCHPAVEEEECYRAHRHWAERHADPVSRLPPPTGRCADPGRRLRLGYLSGDFRAHAVSAFLEPLFVGRDRAAFELFCYRALQRGDELTDRYRELADQWHDVHELTDDALAALIRSHEVDILVDLTGLTRGQRLPALARKPAPVQIEYLGYLGSTGVTAMDYRITDALADPPGHSERFHTERLIRLPRTQWAYVPNPGMPEPFRLPDDAPLTFGSFHRVTKLHARQLALWAELLARLPAARLEMVDIQSEEVRERVLAPFLARGISGERIGTHARLERDRYWELMQRTHIALDAFPYNGGASTCEALWMGVPVVSRVGRHGFSRSAASILGVLDLPELMADTDSAYLETAIALAGDRERLAALRGGLRDRMQASPLLDTRGFMRDLEQAYRGAWERYCAAAVA